MKIEKINIKHKTKYHSIKKYFLVLLVLIIYLIFTSIKIGFQNGLSVTILTWSFFVFCTPIADAGFLLDLPIRIITKIKMIYSEIIVWIIAILINIFYLIFNSQIYSKNLLLSIFKHILIQPIPYWGIIILSGLGTFLSISFFDELVDVKFHQERTKFHKHSLKYDIIVFLFIISLIIIIYFYLIKELGINIPII